MTMAFLVFDIGQSLGWASGSRVNGELSIARTGRELLFGTRHEKLSQALDEVRRIIREEKPDVVAYERPFCRGMAATRSLWGYAGVIEAVATNEGCAVLDEDNKKLKKHIAGYGGATKGDVIAAVNKTFGLQIDNEHTADAVALLDYMTLNAEVPK